MNDRIDKIAREMGMPYAGGPAIAVRPKDLKKFAELIVRECLSIMVDERQRQLGEFYHSNPNGTAQDFIGMSGAIFTVDRIKQHFGVKE